MIRGGIYWYEGESGYSSIDCHNVSDAVIASINAYLQEMRVDDYNYLAKENGLEYFRESLDTGKVVIMTDKVVKDLKNLKSLEQIKEKIHTVVEDIKGLNNLFSESCIKERQNKSANNNI